MTDKELEFQERVIGLLADVLNLDREQLNPLSSMETIAQWDSLQHLGVVVAMEEEFGRPIPPELIPALDSVSNIVKWAKGEELKSA